MVGGIGGNNGAPPSGFRSVGGPASNKPADATADVSASQQATPIATPTPETEKALKGQMEAASALGKSQLGAAKGPAKSMQVLMAAIPPGGEKDKLLTSVAEKVASKTVPNYNTMDDMDKAMALSDIRVAILENPELSGMLGIKL